MLTLNKPQALKKGDRVATVSLSWGGAGDEQLRWRYDVGKRRLQDQFGLDVMEMSSTLKGSKYVYCHPEARAYDLMRAFEDNSIRAIFSCIGGDDSIRMLPYIDFEVIRRNPKLLIGYSDTTITHFMCLKAQVASVYGPSVLGELAENIRIFDYTAYWLERTLFHAEPLGVIPAAEEWTGERLEWSQSNADIAKKMSRNIGYEWLQGEGVAVGPLIGGCIEVMEMMKGTALWPDAHQFDGAILFFETSEDMPEPAYIEYWLRNYGSQGILQKACAILWGKPYQEKYYAEYKKSILKILAELGLNHLPVVYNMTFGHNQPMMCLPYGAMAKVDCNARSFSILEAGVR